MNMEEEVITSMSHDRKKVLVVVPVQGILLVPLRAKLSTLEYRYW